MSARKFAACVLGAATIATGAVVVGATPAGAAAPTCAKSASVVWHSAHGSMQIFDKRHPNGAKFKGSTIKRGANFFELHSRSIRMKFGHNTYLLGGNAIFTLDCSGVSKSAGAVMPDVRLLRGTAKVHTTRTVLGSVSTEEGLFGPVQSNPAMAYSMSRTLSQRTKLTFNQIGNWLMNYTNQPRGTSKTKTLRSGKLVNVTPYVGPRIGSCRHVKSAKLWTTSTYGHGHSIFHF